MGFEYHFGNVTQQCSTQETSDALAGKAPYQSKADALYPYDTQRLVPSCIGKDASGNDIVVYKKSLDYVLVAAAGLLVILLLVLILSLFKGKGTPNVQVIR